MNVENLEVSTETKEENLEKTVPKSGRSSKDWKDRLLEMDLLSPVYVFIFIVLFKDGKDGMDLHDAIVRFVATYNGQ